MEKARYTPRVGDVVYDAWGNKCVITNADDFIYVMYEDGKTTRWGKGNTFVPTGKSVGRWW